MREICLNIKEYVVLHQLHKFSGCSQLEEEHVYSYRATFGIDFT